MSICTAAQAVESVSYWVGYYEKASSKYVNRRDKAVFELDKGSANMTYFGQYCGIQGGAWCAMMVATAIAEACGDNKTDAKKVMHGVWPYAACNQLYDAAPANMKGKRGSWNPIPGDVIIFSSNGTTREHTGMVYLVEGNYVYTIEGNSSNMCKKRSYPKTSSYIWGYVRPAYAAGGGAPNVKKEQYGPKCCSDPELHELSKGCAGAEVYVLQCFLRGAGITGSNGKVIEADGEFGPSTKIAVQNLQGKLGLTQDGCVGKDTWTAILKHAWVSQIESTT